MALFPSREWCEAAIRFVNADPESAAAGESWVGDFGAVVDSEPGKLEKPFAVHCVPAGGRITRFRVLADPDELDEIEPRYLARAPYSVWKGLIRGELDPIQAIAQRRLQFQGDLEQLARRMKYKGIADRVLAAFETQFIDEL
jgi:hypothetical protein